MMLMFPTFEIILVVILIQYTSKKNKSQPWETSTTQIDLSIIVCRGDGKDLKINSRKHVSMAHFEDLGKINKKVIQSDLPGSLLWDIRSTQRAKIA
jgi:hypothetical protein